MFSMLLPLPLWIFVPALVPEIWQLKWGVNQQLFFSDCNGASQFCSVHVEIGLL